jgi:formylglycine-generating enzyme required for sulfatase activity
MRLATYLLLILIIFSGLSCKKSSDSNTAPGKPEVVNTKTGIEMVLIPAGWFEMGSKEGEADESPVHRVWVDSFLIDRYEVTQGQYTRLADSNPSHFRDSGRPVDTIAWADAALYCNLRSRAEDLQPCYDEETAECDFAANGYRLPTEAEWEYACRSGTDTEFCFGSDMHRLKGYAWYAENSHDRTHPVGQKNPNAFGLYDMYGNVAEWCNDVYSSNYYKASPSRNPRGPKEGDKQVLRGGAWDSSMDHCRSAWRTGEEFGFVDACTAQNTIGFRCVRNAPQNAVVPPDNF